MPKAMPEEVTMEKLVSLCKRRGFIFQSSEIYGGLGSCWDYGPLGAELENNVNLTNELMVEKQVCSSELEKIRVLWNSKAEH